MRKKKSSTLLPVLVVLMITLVVGFIALSGRTNAPPIAGNPDYPHHVCTFDRYCAGAVCTSTPIYVIAYMNYVDGRPRLEVPGMSTLTDLTRTDEALIYASTTGNIKGTLTIYRDRALDFVATSQPTPEDDPIEHYASGQCDRLVEP
ncbi:hypothetical protein [Pseudooctadecabacter jejudonensis]|uniref:Uncharacterized protein n=1 Tax=Pseudooctadecabacter jejudonensis TaxID=1391910 RepID=A0A1Y5REY6_9RHOB|nr:hypothetical protein [Pseudooctadecabacter jejudonensis]SLN15918.1 hypothetical protein PSJ8397_00378 [Pseudooctadecabacter jejudonensis]